MESRHSELLNGPNDIVTAMPINADASEGTVAANPHKKRLLACLAFGAFMVPFDFVAMMLQEDVQEPAPRIISDPFVIPHQYVVQPVEDALFELISPLLLGRDTTFLGPLFTVVAWASIAFIVSYLVSATRRRLRRTR